MSRKPWLVIAFLTMLVPLVASAASGTVHFTVQIDGTSELQLSGSTARWHHLTWDPPGTTVINGVPWNPTGLSQHCGCDSDTFSGVLPPIPPNATSFDVTVNDGRGAVTVVQYPDPGNGRVLIVRIDDEAEGGADDYDVTIEWATPTPIPIASTAGLMLLCVLLTGAGFWFLRR